MKKKNDDIKKKNRSANKKTRTIKEDCITTDTTTIKNQNKRKSIPYNGFFGQLSNKTTTKNLFRHIQKGFARYVTKERRSIIINNNNNQSYYSYEQIQ